MGGRKDNCILAESEEVSKNLQFMEDELPKLKSMMDQSVGLEEFLTRLGESYHNNGHTTIGVGQYKKVLGLY